MCSSKMRSVILMLLQKVLDIEKLFRDFQLREGELKKEQENWPHGQPIITRTGTEQQWQRTYNNR